MQTANGHRSNGARTAHTSKNSKNAQKEKLERIASLSKMTKANFFLNLLLFGAGCYVAVWKSTRLHQIKSTSEGKSILLHKQIASQPLTTTLTEEGTNFFQSLRDVWSISKKSMMVNVEANFFYRSPILDISNFRNQTRGSRHD